MIDYLKKKIFKIKFLFHKHILQTKKPLRSFYGVLLTPSYQDKTFQYCFKGTYGRFLDLLIEDISIPSVFIDIGANQGLYSVLAGKNSSIEKVYAFEPNPSIIPLLKNNLLINGVKKHQIIPSAISNQAGELTFQSQVGHTGKGTLRKLADESEIHFDTIKINAINHLELNKLISTSLPNYIKIDAEGHEEIVLRQLLDCSFLKNTQWIFCEIDEKWVNPHVIVNLLKDHGFKTVQKIGSKASHYDLLIKRE